MTNCNDPSFRVWDYSTDTFALLDYRQFHYKEQLAPNGTVYQHFGARWFCSGLYSCVHPVSVARQRECVGIVGESVLLACVTPSHGSNV